ncbi:MAG: hypothetical protein AB7F35_06355 [Acetobacteraceae bacterium]
MTAFGLENLVLDATITANSEATGLDADNVANDWGSAQYAWQTVAGVVTEADGALIRIEPTTPAQTWRALGIFRSNLTSDATVNFTLWNDNGGSPSVVWTDSVSGPPAGYGQVVVVLDADTTADFLQIWVDDEDNPDGFINIPLIYAGPLWIPTWGEGLRSQFGRRNRTDTRQSIGGTEYVNHRWMQRWRALGFDATKSDTEVWQYAMELDALARLGGNVLAIPNITSADINYEAVFGMMAPPDAMTFGLGTKTLVSWTATVSERL